MNGNPEEIGMYPTWDSNVLGREDAAIGNAANPAKPAAAGAKSTCNSSSLMNRHLNMAEFWKVRQTGIKTFSDRHRRVPQQSLGGKQTE